MASRRGTRGDGRTINGSRRGGFAWLAARLLPRGTFLCCCLVEAEDAPGALGCPMPGSSLHLKLSRRHRPLYVRFLPLDREHQSSAVYLFESRIYFDFEFCSKEHNFLCVLRALTMYLVTVRALENKFKKYDGEVQRAGAGGPRKKSCSS